jgi:DNA-directed RNA polymerase specialized sigma subunit
MARPRLPLDEQAVLQAYQEGDTLPTIAERLGVDRSRVTRVVDEAGVRRDDRGRHWAAKRRERTS